MREQQDLFKTKAEFTQGEIDKWQYIEKMYQIHKQLFSYTEFIKETNISKIEIEDDVLAMTFRDSGIKLICSPQDRRPAPFESLNFGDNESDELQMQMSLIKENDTVLDIGANYGWYSAHIGQKFPSAKIYAFEPIPKTYGYLQNNLKINNINNVEALNIGLGEEKGTFTFYFDPQLSGNASLNNLSNAPTVESVVCQVSTIDTIVAEKNLRIDFIKCDIEGAELLAFKGGKAVLQRDKPIIFSEMLRKWSAKFNYHPNDIIAFLGDLGYACFTMNGKILHPLALVDESTVETNFLFLHKEKHSSIITSHS
jgi:FkbM family methyltransferase